MRQKIVFYLALTFVLSSALKVSADCDNWVAKAVSVEGKVQTQHSGNQDWQAVKQEDQFCPGDKIRTGKRSRATLRYVTESIFTVDQNSTLIFSDNDEKKESWFINLLDGQFFFRSREPQRLDLRTPFINAVHEGTEFLVAVDDSHTEITVFDGQVAGNSPQGSIKINTGSVGIAQKGQPPHVQPLAIRPEDAVQWTLYYPPIINYPDRQATISPSLRNALANYQHGNVSDALASLDDVPFAQRDHHYLVLKAALLLSVGRVDEAEQNLAFAARLPGNQADVLALQATIAVSKNQHNSALQLAEQAVVANPQSSAAKVALSYAYQASLKIDAALTAAREAAKLSPDNALAWARLAELQLATGNRYDALKSAQTAQKLNPSWSRTQTVLGFAKLAQVDTDAATGSFQHAITLDSSDPLPRLGLGLAKIRTGDVEAGKAELEAAVNLDPNNSVIRSYLGKAYYELRNKEYAGTEYKLAKELDPKDPTPWFYDAILKQTINRPIEALQDMQKAVELNDNRGVYRSQLLLDDDSAARSASLGRIFNDLGFQQRGLLEGWTGVNRDPSNYSAHRFLSDNYAVMPRHEIARVSELLKAQLLQPINLTPVQPQSASSNLLILDNLGPTVTSFNEYNPMFARNRLGLQASGFYGSNNTGSDEVVQSGVWNNLSYSLGQFHYATDGSRTNNDLVKNSYNFFAQASITPATNVQVELRHSDQKNGDIAQSFLADEFSTAKRQKTETNSVRGGLHQAFSPNSDLLMSLIYTKLNSDNSDVFTPIPDFPAFTLDQKDSNHADGLLYELQHLYRSQYYDLTSGFGHLIQSNDQVNFVANSLASTSKPEIDHDNLYLYSNIKPISELIVSLGLSVDLYEKTDQAKLDRQLLNPKFGLTWQATKDTTVRLAAFRAFKRSLVENQTLEPTQIAGFNQFFDDQTATNSERVGFGLDHKIDKQVFTGVEISHRRLDLPYDVLSYDPPSNNFIQEFKKTTWQEQNARAYVNWTPNTLFALSGEYHYDKFNRNRVYQLGHDNFTYLETHRAQWSGNFFHSSGLISKIGLSFVDQTGVFYKPGFTSTYKGKHNDQFWLLDTELGFRFNKRHGLIAVGIKNLLDEHFNFQGVDVNQPGLQQGRFLFSRLTLSF